MKSMGATSRSIMKIFIYQGLIVGLIGTALGCAAGLTVALNLQKVSQFVEKMFDVKFLPGFFIDDHFAVALFYKPDVI